MSLAEFLRGIPVRVLPIEENMFREVTLRVSEPELQALVDLALEGALARRAQGAEVTGAMVGALAQLQATLDARAAHEATKAA